MKRMRSPFYAVASVWALLGVTSTASASIDASPNCGVYALYTAMRIEGVRVELPDLMKPQYISSREGSRLSDLELAARRHGMYACVMGNLSVSDLSRSHCPMILHVKTEYDAPTYNHFILCVPDGKGLIALYDPPRDPVWTTGTELAPLWDGTAVIISARPIRWVTGRAAVLNWGIGAFCLLGGMTLLRGSRFRCRWSLPAWGQVTAIGGVAVAFACLQHLGWSGGFGSHRPAVRAIQTAAFESPCPVAGVGDVESAAGGAGYLIEARSPTDYEIGHIDRAINVSAGAPREMRAKTMADVPRDANIIVYCESSSCPLAPFVARRLVADGFTAVRVFPGGWEQWLAAHARPREVRG